MHRAAEIEQNRSARHGCLHDLIVRDTVDVAQVLRTGHDPRRSVVFREFGQRNHRRDLPLHSGDAHRIEIVIPVQHLVAFAWHDLDRGGGADAVDVAVALQHTVGHTRHEGMGQNLRCRAAERQYAAQTPRLVAVEVIAELQALFIEWPAQVRQHAINYLLRYHAFHDHRTVCQQSLCQRRGIG